MSTATYNRVETINWTYATGDVEINYREVHRNVCCTTLEELVEWLQGNDEIAEDIVSIERIGADDVQAMSVQCGFCGQTLGERHKEYCWHVEKMRYGQEDRTLEYSS